MKVTPTSIPDVLLIEPQIFGDERGFFLETFQKERYAQFGIAVEFVQDNHSGSRQDTLRGLHYQIHHAQGKLLWPVVGEIYDVAVDLRRHSPYFGKYVGVVLSAVEHQQIWIPQGFAHGFYVISEWAEIFYKATASYSPADERTLLWCDPMLGIPWPIPQGSHPILSKKDAIGKLLGEVELFQ